MLAFAAARVGEPLLGRAKNALELKRKITEPMSRTIRFAPPACKLPLVISVGLLPLVLGPVAQGIVYFIQSLAFPA